jgi:glycosyltransferase involved in cell wall biosynthesis
MAKLSVTVITLNEEKNIGECLESVKWADEILVVDSNSSDKTVDTARQFGAKVISNPWPGHIQQKNFAVDHASGEWILSLDADERVSEELKCEIQNLMCSRIEEYSGYRMPRKNFYLGKWILHSGWYPDYKIRLFRKDAGRWSGINPHDSVTVDGKVGILRGDILHYSYKDVTHNLKTIDNFSTIGSGELFRKGRVATAFDLAIRPVVVFFKKYIVKLGFLDGWQGFIIAGLTSYSVFCKYVKLWELNNVRRR